MVLNQNPPCALLQGRFRVAAPLGQAFASLGSPVAPKFWVSRNTKAPFQEVARMFL